MLMFRNNFKLPSKFCTPVPKLVYFLELSQHNSDYCQRRWGVSEVYEQWSSISSLIGILPAGPFARTLHNSTKLSLKSILSTSRLLQGKLQRAASFQKVSQDEDINIIFKVYLFEYFKISFNALFKISAAMRQEREEWIFFNTFRYQY